MSEHLPQEPNLPKEPELPKEPGLPQEPVLHTDSQKFQDAMRSILAAPKKEVMEQLATEKEERKQRRLPRSEP